MRLFRGRLSVLFVEMRSCNSLLRSSANFAVKHDVTRIQQLLAHRVLPSTSACEGRKQNGPVALRYNLQGE